MLLMTMVIYFRRKKKIQQQQEERQQEEQQPRDYQDRHQKLCLLILEQKPDIYLNKLIRFVENSLCVWRFLQKYFFNSFVNKAKSVSLYSYVSRDQLINTAHS